MAAQAILIVDDDPVQRRLLSGVLNSVHGTEILSACCGREALELLRDGTHDISLIMLDIYMPDCDGAEVVTELAKLNSDVGLVMMSANAGILPVVETMARAFGLNVLGAVPKPIDRRYLALVSAWLNQRHEPQTLGSMAEASESEHPAVNTVAHEAFA